MAKTATGISPTQPAEFNIAKGFAFPLTGRTARGATPQYANQGSLGIYLTDHVTLALNGTIAATSLGALTQTVFLANLTTLALAKTDLAQALVIPVSVVSNTAGLLLGGVNLQLQSTGPSTIGANGTLTPGQTYSGLKVVASMGAYNPTAGSLTPTITVAAQVLILGNVKQ